MAQWQACLDLVPTPPAFLRFYDLAFSLKVGNDGSDRPFGDPDL
jgi:hypothetical protein